MSRSKQEIFQDIHITKLQKEHAESRIAYLHARDALYQAEIKLFKLNEELQQQHPPPTMQRFTIGSGNRISYQSPGINAITSNNNASPKVIPIPSLSNSPHVGPISSSIGSSDVIEGVLNLTTGEFKKPPITDTNSVSSATSGGVETLNNFLPSSPSKGTKRKLDIQNTQYNKKSQPTNKTKI
jgi:hypothetical protein